MDAFGIITKSIFIGFTLVLSVTGCEQESKQKLMIATTASMRLPLVELVKEFTKESGKVCELVFASSGKLSAQIQAGAPYDVFISANMKYPDNLYAQGISFKPKVVGYGRLVLWSNNDGLQPSLDVLLNDSVSHVAMANPKTAPYGEAALEVLKKHNIFEQLKHKLVYGESISQTDQFIVSGAAQIGFTSKSTVLSNEGKGKGHWMEVERTLYSPIKHGSVVIKNDREMQFDADAFIEFIYSKKGRSIMKKYGLEL